MQRSRRKVDCSRQSSISIFTYPSHDLAVLWIDSHPDVGTPASKHSGYHAMAIAVLTGYGDPDVVRLLPATLDPTRVALVGLHSWTEDDFPNIARWGIRSFGPDDLHPSSEPLLAWLKASGCSRIAIHFDVDVVKSNEIIFGLGAEPAGLTSNEARRLVADVSAIADVVGLTIAEFIPRQASDRNRGCATSRSSKIPKRGSPDPDGLFRCLKGGGDAVERSDDLRMIFQVVSVSHLGCWALARSSLAFAVWPSFS